MALLINDFLLDVLECDKNNYVGDLILISYGEVRKAL
jgi:hypothetical protein